MSSGWTKEQGTWIPPSTDVGPHRHEDDLSRLLSLEASRVIDQPRLTSLEASRVLDQARLVVLETAVTAMAKWIRATATGRLIQSGTNVLTTDGGGGAGFAFPTAFSAAPDLVLTAGDAGAGDQYVHTVEWITATNCWFTTVLANSGARVGGALLRVRWMAMGAA